MLYLVLLAGISGSSVDVATWQNNSQAAYTLTTDDCRESQITEVEPALSSRGLVGTFFINPSDTFWAWREYKENYITFPSRGHELGSHTMKHQSVISNDIRYPDDSFSSVEELDQDCRMVEDVLMSLTGYHTNSFAYPWGRDDAESREIISKHYLSARDVSNYREVEGRFIPNPVSPTDMYALDCFVAAGTNSWWPGHNFNDYDNASALFTQYVNDTVDAGGWGIEYSHGISEEGKTAYLEHLDYVVDKIAEGALWNATQGDVAKYIYSRDATVISMINETADYIAFTADDGLDDEVFNVPITLIMELPDNFNLPKVVINSKEVDFKLADRIITLTTLANDSIVQVFSNDASTIPGDINKDGSVDSYDLDILRNSWATNGIGDITSDKYVGSNDLDIVRANWGQQVKLVPEPTIAVLIILFIMMSLCRKNKSINW